MKSFVFISIVLISGCFAGLIYSGLNLVIVEPYLDQAISIENQNLFLTGEKEDGQQFWVEYYDYRVWQKGGQVIGGMILGTSLGALFGIIYALTRNSLPSKKHIGNTLILAGIMWVTLFVIPFLKYPANPPTVGDAETVVLRGILYISFIAISGFSALGFYKLFNKLKRQKRIIPFIGYSIFISLLFFIMPENPDEITAPTELINQFRIAAFITSSIFWLSLALILGMFWQKTKPEIQT